MNACRALAVLALCVFLCACGLMRTEPTPDAIATQAALLARRSQTLTPDQTVDLDGCLFEAALVSETAGRIARIRAGREAQEGLGAFLEKRQPAWCPSDPA